MKEEFLMARIRHYLNNSGPHTLREIAVHLGESMEKVTELLHAMTVDGSVFYSASSDLWKAVGWERR